MRAVTSSIEKPDRSEKREYQLDRVCHLFTKLSALSTWSSFEPCSPPHCLSPVLSLFQCPRGTTSMALALPRLVPLLFLNIFSIL